MKKSLAAIVLGLLFSGNVYAERITMNELLENKYTIKKQEMIKFEKRALKIFTLEKSRKIMERSKTISKKILGKASNDS